MVYVFSLSVSLYHLLWLSFFNRLVDLVEGAGPNGWVAGEDLSANHS